MPINIEFINRSELILSENNPRVHNVEQLELISESINNFGFLNPLVIDENNRILAGHGRFLAYKGDNFPCVRTSDLTEEQKNNFMGRDAKYVCGMSVPPNMMYHIANQINKQWLTKGVA